MNPGNILRVVLLRHGQTKCNVEKRLQFIQDPLTQFGKDQIHKSLLDLKKFNFDKILCSDEIRAIESAKIINQHFKTNLRKTPLLREKNSGDFSEKLVADVDWKLIEGDFLTKKIPNGESVMDVIKRVQEFISILNQNNLGEEILVISHGTFLRILIATLFDYDYEYILKNYKYPNGKYMILIKEPNGKWKIEESCLIK